MRYNPVNTKKKTSVNMSTNLVNKQSIDSKILKKDGKDVLTDGNIIKSLEEYRLETDNESKVPSLAVVKLLIKETGGGGSGGNGGSGGSGGSGGGNGGSGGNGGGGGGVSNKNISLFSDMQTLKKEKTEIHSKTDVLLDEIETPDFLTSPVRKELIEALSLYDNDYNELILFMNELIEKEEVTEEDYDKFDLLVEKYITSFDEVNKAIQLSTQTLMTIRSNNVLEKAEESIKEIASNIYYKIEVSCDKGPFHRYGEIDLDLIANVYKGKENITTEFNEVQFVWSRKSNNPTSDANWNLSVKRGNILHVSNSDYEKGGCSFVCSLYDLAGRVLITSSPQ